MQDGLYLFNQWVCQVRIPLTFQANDLTKPDTQEASFSRTVTLPDSQQIRSMLENAEQIDSASIHPHRYIPAKVVEDGEVIFEGLAKLDEFSAGWKCTLLEGKRSLLETLREKPLRDMDLRQFDFNWDIPTITGLNTLPSGIVFPLIDYGSIADGIVPSDTIYPAITTRVLIGQMLAEQGYRSKGDWLNDPLLNALAIPFVEADPTAFDDVWVKDRSARITVPEGSDIILSNYGALDFSSFGKLNRIQPLSVDGPITSGFNNGKAGNYKTTLATYVPDVNMRLQVHAFQAFRARVTSGAPEVILSVEVNGANVGQGYWSKGGPYNNYGGATESLIREDRVEVDVTVDLKAGDQVRIRLYVEKRTTFGKMEVIIYQSSDTAWAAFTPIKEIKYGDKWPVARNLPDLKCLNILQDVAYATSSWWYVDDMRRTLELVPLNSMIEAVPVDWTDRIDTATEPTYIPKIEPYGQRNYLKWKETDEVIQYSGGSATAGGGPKKYFGDGLINCNAETLETDVILFTMSFSASVQSTVDVANYGKPLKIETRTVATAGTATTISKKVAMPRLILIEPTCLVEVKTKIAGASIGTFLEVTVKLMGCWFARRPDVLVTADNAFSLAFDPVTGQFAEQSLIDRYFFGLKQILRKPRVLTLTAYLRPHQVSALRVPGIDGKTDLMRPVRIRRLRIGSLEISQSEFLINKVADRVSGNTCPVTLIAY